MNCLDEDLLHVIDCYTKYFQEYNLTETILFELKQLFDIDESTLKEHIDYFFKYISVKRQTSWKLSSNIQKDAKKRVEIVEKKDQPEQKSDEWYKYRYEMLTASSLWKIFKSESTQKELIKTKRMPLDISKYKNVNTTSSLHWGHKYEPISVLFYETLFKTKIGDFGCIKHSEYNFLGASPDGINIDEKNLLYGRMLEIKNIVNRTLNGIPKYEYWIQMQLQMEVCNLDYCDFLECSFVEYDSYDDFIHDGTFNKTSQNMLKGIIIQFCDENGPKYYYPPIDYTQEEFEEWKSNLIEINSNMSWITDIYWKLDEYSCVLVERNKEWFKQNIDNIKEFWLKII